MNKQEKTNLTNKISLPKGLIVPDNGKPIETIEIPLRASELDLIRDSIMKRQKIVFNRILHLKRSDSRVKAQIEDNILTSTMRRMGSIKSEKRFPLKAFDNEWEEILLCLKKSRRKSREMCELIEFLSMCLHKE